MNAYSAIMNGVFHFTTLYLQLVASALQTMPVLDPSEYPFANIGPAIGRKVTVP